MYLRDALTHFLTETTALCGTLSRSVVPHPQSREPGVDVRVGGRGGRGPDPPPRRVDFIPSEENARTTPSRVGVFVAAASPFGTFRFARGTFGLVLGHACVRLPCLPRPQPREPRVDVRVVVVVVVVVASSRRSQTRRGDPRESAAAALPVPVRPPDRPYARLRLVRRGEEGGSAGFGSSSRAASDRIVLLLCVGSNRAVRRPIERRADGRSADPRVRDEDEPLEGADERLGTRRRSKGPGRDASLL